MTRPLVPAWTAIVLFAIGIATTEVVLMAEDPVVVPVDQSALPSGAGFAAKVADQSRLANHPAVIFVEDFESGELGTGWDEVRNQDGNTLDFVSLEGESKQFGRRSLRVTGRLGENTGGGMTRWFSPSRDVHVRFYTRFDRQCDYVHHFVTLRANRGLKGGDRWSGFGGAGKLPKGDRRFSTALEPWGNWGRWSAPGRWNFYSYWHQMNPSPDGKYWGNGFRPEEQPNIPKDKWICCEFLLRHNTPGKSDGEQAFWIDGQLQGHWKKIQWRTDEALKANALTLESYVTDRWTKNPTNIVHFDNVVVASEYIGPNPVTPNEHP